MVNIVKITTSVFFLISKIRTEWNSDNTNRPVREPNARWCERRTALCQLILIELSIRLCVGFYSSKLSKYEKSFVTFPFSIVKIVQIGNSNFELSGAVPLDTNSTIILFSPDG